MTFPFIVSGQTITFRFGFETLRIEPFGPDGARVRATPQADFPAGVPGALLEPAASPEARVESSEGAVALVNGRLRVELRADGTLHFSRADTGSLLFEEPEPAFNRPPTRWWRQPSGDLFRLEVTFKPNPGERFYGLGQHQHGRLNQRGCVILLEQRNSEVNIPFLVSSRGYGFLWNHPGLGQVELAENATRWKADAARGMDYYVVAGDSTAEILARYADATGHAPRLPDFALGFWQCKLRYRTQEELLAVAREYHRRGLPLSVIVADYFHWAQMGEWAFDPAAWPDPAGMTAELKRLGVELMVSIWPTVNRNSPSFEAMEARGLLTRSDRGAAGQTAIPDATPDGVHFVTYYDATHPEARRYLLERVLRNYYRNGVRVFWLDADEPEVYPIDAANLRYRAGSGAEVGGIYPYEHQRGFYEALREAGEEQIVTLSRSAWAGSQRWGAAVWSGDIRSRFEVLRVQIPAGLNIGLSGIPWWTTDIGGFEHGNIYDPTFRELIVRWFQYGVFCPLFRLHGNRLPGSGSDHFNAAFSGADNEIWSFGEQAYPILKHLLFLRERLRPYLRSLADEASRVGLPPMRPLFVDFEQDPQAAAVEDQFMLGPDLLVAQVAYEGMRERPVYLPAWAEWVDAWTGDGYAGGQTLTAPAPIERIPVYWRKGSPWAFDFNRI